MVRFIKILSILAVLLCPTKSNAESWHTDGMYVLELVHPKPNGEIEIIPLAVFPNLQWAVMECNTAKENLIARMGGYLFENNLIPTCARFRKDEL